jgi:class 3 adenylate cyclase
MPVALWVKIRPSPYFSGFHAVEEHRFGYRARSTQVGRHSRGWRCRLFASDGSDEEGTHERLKAHLRQFVDPKIKAHRGRIVKNTGDGILVEFSSVVDAVRCAAETQRAMIDRNTDIPADKRISFRMGINLGDVIVEPKDIFGDGVNIAARLEALAEPGGICISRVVRDQVRDKLPYVRGHGRAASQEHRKAGARVRRETAPACWYARDRETELMEP